MVLGLYMLVKSRAVSLNSLYFSFHSTLRQYLVQVGNVVLIHLLPLHPLQGHGRGRGYVKQSVDWYRMNHQRCTRGDHLSVTQAC